MQQFTAAFATVFFLFALGFGVQRWRPLDEQTLTQLSVLVVEILLPFYLFFTTAITPPESLRVAPLLIVVGALVSLFSYGLASLALKPAAVADRQRSVFRFANMIANTAFLGIPICAALFGPIGAVYAVLYDFGTTLVVLTVGIWALKGGRFDDWRPLVVNPLIWGVLAGLLWAFMGWPFPDWLVAPFETLGNAALPLALLMGGTQIGNLHSPGFTWWRQLTGLTLTRLVVAPLVVGLVLILIGWRDLFASIIIIQAAMPVGLTTAIFAKSYGADAEFAASATLWSTLAAMVSLPVVAFLVSSQ